MPTSFKPEFPPGPQSAPSSTETNSRGLGGEIWHSVKDFVGTALYTGIAEPILGVTQIGDKAAGSGNFKAVSNGFAALGISAPEKASSTLDSHAQMLGSAVGMLLPYLVLHKTIRTGATNVFGAETFGQRSAIGLMGRGEFGSVVAKEAGLAFTTGFTYDAVFRPSDGTSDSFIKDRFLNGMTGGATMATLAASSFGLNRLGSSGTIKQEWAKTLLTNPISANVLSAVPAGLVSAEAHALRSGKLLPTAAEAGHSIYQMGFVGAALGGAHYLGAPRQGTNRTNFEYLVTDRLKSKLSTKDAATNIEPSSPAPIEATNKFESFKSGELVEIETTVQRAERLNLPKDMEQSKDLLFGKVKNADGTFTDVVIRRFSDEANPLRRVYRAEVSNNVNETLKSTAAVDSPALPLVLRENVTLPDGPGTVMIQQNGGKQLGAQLREWATDAYGKTTPEGQIELPTGGITKLINNNPEVRELMARAAFDNMFKGNVDLVEFSQQTLQEGTTGIKLDPSGKLKLAAIDNKNDFTTLDKTSWGFGSQFGLTLEVAKALEGKRLSEISPKLQADAEAILKVFTSEEGRAKLLADGLTAKEIDAARDRLTLLVQEGFPKHLGETDFYADEAKQELTASFTSAYDTERDVTANYIESRDKNLVIDSSSGEQRVIKPIEVEQKDAVDQAAVKLSALADLTKLSVNNPKTGDVLDTNVRHSVSEKGSMPEVTLFDSNNNKVGYLRYEIVDPKPGEKSMNFLYGYPERTQQSFLWIDMMRVEAEFQGKGVREAIVAELVKESKRLGFEGRVKLQASDQFGSVSAIPWYKAGFRAQAGALHHGVKVEQAIKLLEEVTNPETKRQVGLEEGKLLSDLLMYLPTKK